MKKLFVTLYYSIFEPLIGVSLLIYVIFGEPKNNQILLIFISLFFLFNFAKRKFKNSIEKNKNQKKSTDINDVKKDIIQNPEYEPYNHWEEDKDEIELTKRIDELITKSKSAYKHGELDTFYKYFPNDINIKTQFLSKIKINDIDFYKRIKKARFKNRLIFKLFSCFLFLLFVAFLRVVGALLLVLFIVLEKKGFSSLIIIIEVLFGILGLLFFTSIVDFFKFREFWNKE